MAPRRLATLSPFGASRPPVRPRGHVIMELDAARPTSVFSHGLTIVLGTCRGMCIAIVPVIVLLASALHAKGS